MEEPPIPHNEGAYLIAELFNKSLTIEQRNKINEEIIDRMCNFMRGNGYRIVFNHWYKQS